MCGAVEFAKSLDPELEAAVHRPERAGGVAIIPFVRSAAADIAAGDEIEARIEVFRSTFRKQLEFDAVPGAVHAPAILELAAKPDGPLPRKSKINRILPTDAAEFGAFAVRLDAAKVHLRPPPIRDAVAR